MKVEEKNILIASVPRSGSSWLGAILAASRGVSYRFQPNFSYSFPYSVNEFSSAEELILFFNELVKTDDPFVLGRRQIDGASSEIPESGAVLNSTLVWKEVHNLQICRNLLEKGTTKIIGLVRSPFAVLSSWKNAPREFRVGWNFEDEWFSASKKNGEHAGSLFGLQKWIETRLLFRQLKKEWPDDFLLVHYDDLLAQTLSETKNIFKFIELPLDDAVSSFLRKSRASSSSSKYGVYNSRESDEEWRIHISDPIRTLINLELNKSGLSEYCK